MPSLVHSVHDQLVSLGEYVVLANIASGWFAVFESTLLRQTELARKNGRAGPNLIIYRTRNEASEPRDHYVVPHAEFQAMVTDETVAAAKIKSSRRWNFTMKEDRLRVTHGAGYLDVAPYHGVPLLIEAAASVASTATAPVALRFQLAAVLEGLAKEYRVVSRSRSAGLREAALRASGGVCEACGVNFGALLGGLGARALQVHHKNQLASANAEVVTSVRDLAVLCANCHSLVHANPDELMSVEHLQDLWRNGARDVNLPVNTDAHGRQLPAVASFRGRRLRVR
jgi:hypothetical protein